MFFISSQINQFYILPIGQGNGRISQHMFLHIDYGSSLRA